MIKIKKIFNKHHQQYLLISFFIFIFLIVLYSLNFSKKNSNISTISPTPTLLISQPTKNPTTATKVSSRIYTIGARKLEAKLDPKTNEILLYFKENGQDVLINSIVSPNDEGELSPNFSISSDNNYLTYMVADGDFSIYKLYSFPEQKNTTLKINPEYSGYSKDNKYFYICSIGGFSDGGAYIYHLPKMELVYQDKNNSAKCQYDSSNNSLKISYTDYDKPFFTNTIYYFNTNKAVSQ